jgi:hypothetical protein
VDLVLTSLHLHPSSPFRPGLIILLGHTIRNFMSDHANTFDYLFDELERFSPDIDESDLFVPNVSSSSQNSSSIPPISSYIPISSSLRIVSQNVMKSNVAIHSLLSVSSSRPFTADILLIQEPWYGRIGIDVITGKDIFGTPSHRDWMCILPTHGDLPPELLYTSPSLETDGKFKSVQTSSLTLL